MYHSSQKGGNMYLMENTQSSYQQYDKIELKWLYIWNTFSTKSLFMNISEIDAMTNNMNEFSVQERWGMQFVQINSNNQVNYSIYIIG